MNDTSQTLFLHGLAGSGREWEALQDRVPAEAPDLRPAGARDDYVSDVVELIGAGTTTLIGHSLGGHTAFLVAARHPDLVTRLVVIEASPDRDPGAPERMRALLREHPAPYGVEIDPEAAARTLAELAARDWWAEWRRVRSPVLVVRGQHGHVDRSQAARMVGSTPHGRAVEIEGAGHDVHLDKPAELADAIEAWIA